MVVEDLFISKYLDSLLSRAGYAVTLTGADRALDLLRKRTAVLVTNTPAAFLELADRAPLLYLSAIPDRSLAARFGACRVLTKPFRAEALLAAVEELCAAEWNASAANA